MKQLILLLFFAAIWGLGSARAQYFTFDSIAAPRYICQAHTFDVEVFGMASSGSTQVGSQNYFISNDSIYVLFHFVSGTGPAMPYPFHRTINIPAPLIFGQYKIIAKGYYNGQPQQSLTSAISICAGFLAIPEPEKTALNITVFPNPARDVLDVSVAKNKTGIKLTLTNVIGTTLQTKIVSAGTLQARLDLRSVPAGVYLLQVSSSEKKIIQKIIKR